MKATKENYQEVLENVCATIAAEAGPVDEQGAFPGKSIAALANSGLLGALSSPEVGGLGLGPRGAAVIIGRVAQECGSTAMAACMHLCGTAVIEAHAPEEVRRSAASGESLTTLAFSEFGSRSHFWVPMSTAQRNGNAVVLNAQKSWITSASRAATYVWSSQPLDGDGMSTLWLVPRNAGGISVQGPFNGLGLRGNDSSPVTADGVEVPLSAMLGADGKGFDVMMGVVLPIFNILNAACSVGFMEAAVKRTAAHVTKTGYAYADSALADLPTIRSYVAQMRVKTDMARTLLEDTISAVEAGRDDSMLCLLECKAGAGEAADEVLDKAMRVCGGAAFRKEVGVERYFRDARAAGVMAPTTDVLYDFIGKSVCGMDLF